MFVREMTGSTVKATYFMGGSGPAYRRDDVTSAVRWYLYDGLGSVLGEVDPSGNITASRKYDVYGSVRSSTGTSTSKHKFVGSLGHSSEDETGLIYMRARFMDPLTGRFASEDATGHGLNWYIYCSNNPVNNIDRNGNIDAALQSLEANVDYSLMAEKCAFGALYGVMALIVGYGEMEQLAIYGRFMAKASKSSAKERATDIPSWAKGAKPDDGQSGKDFAREMMKEKYGEDWDGETGPGSEFGKLKKYGDRFDQ